MRRIQTTNIHSLVFLVLCFQLVFSISLDSSAMLRRYKTKLPLIFHDFGVSQFVCGFGIPVDLNSEAVTSGIVFKSQLPLPAKPQDLRNHTTHSIHGRLISNSAHQSSMKRMRSNLYKTLELWASNIGLDGQDCVLKALCEASHIPFNNETGDLWHDIAHFIFSPFSSTDEFIDNTNDEYFAAAKIGLSDNCDEVFWKCPKSLLAFFSEVF